MLTYKALGNNGRLGNQFFQIASTIGLAKKENKNWCFPEWNYSKYINAPNEWFNNNLFATDLGLYYYQDYNNFLNIEDYIKNIFTPNLSIIDEINNLKSKWMPEDIEYIMVGFRRTDYLTAPGYYPIPTLEYYQNGINFIKSQRADKQIKVICFSDDIEWCKTNVPADIFYEDSHSIDIIKLFLISKAHHFIIANSTFYWWSAYLSNTNSEKIVIYPIKWLGKDVPDKHTFNLFYPKWYGANENKIINFPNQFNINILDAINY
jgi:hypothetical protein